MFTAAAIESPKQNINDRVGRGAFYPYYAGFPIRFAVNLLQSLDIRDECTVLDPWNGSGTTTQAAEILGFSAEGIDRNPAMVLVAKGRAICSREVASVLPLLDDIITKSRQASPRCSVREPLETLMYPQTARKVRELEGAIRRLLIGSKELIVAFDPDDLDKVSDLAGFFYIALFRVVRRLCSRFYGSNPTWLRVPRSHSSRARVPESNIEDFLRFEVQQMLDALVLANDSPAAETKVSIRLGSSTELDLSDDSVDVILTSPPYCTRIDYAVATMAELLLLGYTPQTTFRSLRRALIGNATVAEDAPVPHASWGHTCNAFLAALLGHSSKASEAYYYKNHLSYFDGLARSIAEIARVLKVGGGAVLVVQDSYYKELHNDLPLIVAEMASIAGLSQSKRVDFQHDRTMTLVNPGTRRYARTQRPVESVLCFEKP